MPLFPPTTLKPIIEKAEGARAEARVPSSVRTAQFKETSGRSNAEHDRRFHLSAGLGFLPFRKNSFCLMDVCKVDSVHLFPLS